MEVVERDDIDEANRLMEMSKASLVEDEQGTRRARPVDLIYGIIRDLQKDGATTVKYDDARGRCIAKGFNSDQFQECIDEYERLNIWHVNAGRTRITFIH